MPKAVFIDFDGTYADHGQVPAAHVEAVRAARANGHHVLLCTGRPKSMVSPDVLSALDGLVGAAGGYVEIGGTVLSDVRFPEDVAARVVSVLTSHDVAFTLEAPEGLYGPPGIKERLRDLLVQALGPVGFQEASGEILGPLRASANLGQCSFGKVSIFSSPIPVDELARMIGPQVGALPNSVTGLAGHAGEIHLLTVHKAVGMAVAAAHLGLSREDVIGVGDGHNDLEMLAHAGTAVAVEGAPAELLALADHVIAPPSRAGLAHVFAHLGLSSSPL